VNKDKRVSNGNYLWISYFWSYLNDKGRAGFVMSSQASSAGHGEAQVRRKIIETGDVDVMISVRSNFFYTRTVPCELWHFDRNKPDERRDKVLLIDARDIYRKVTRKINDFSPEQQKNLAAIVWLYRGQTERFIALVQEYLTRTIAEAAGIREKSDTFRSAYSALVDAIPKEELPRESVKERDERARVCFESSDELLSQIARIKPDEPKLGAQKKMLGELEEVTTSCRDLVKDVDLVFKLATRAIHAAEKEAAEKNGELKWNRRGIGKLEKELDARRKDLVEQLKAVSYFERQAHWLLSRFPDAQPVDVPGLVRLVDRKDIEAADWSLTPGRYVGVAPPEVDEDFDFEETLRKIHIELAELNREATELAAKIDKNFEELGV